MASDLVTGLVVSVLLHAIVLGLIGFTWDSDPSLKRAPDVPPFVQAVVMEKPKKAAPVAKPKPSPAPKPRPAPTPRPANKPPEQPAPKPPEAKPEPSLKWQQPDMASILADEELAMEAQPEDDAPATPEDATSSAGDEGEQARQIASHEQAIIASITSRWIVPATARGKDGVVARVRVHLLPGGEVADVALVKTSGDQAFDNSVQAAVRAASPLPVPSGTLFHDSFRIMTIEFNPGMKSQ